MTSICLGKTTIADNDSEVKLNQSDSESQDSEKMITPSSSSKALKRRMHVLSDDEEETAIHSRVNSTPALSRSATVNPAKAKRRLLLEELKDKRSRAHSFEEQPSGQSQDLAMKGTEDKFNELSPQKSYSALAVVDSEDEEQDEQNFSKDDEKEEGGSLEEESDIGSFIVEDSQSQEVEHGYVYQRPDKEESYKRYVQHVLCSVFDDEVLSSSQDDDSPEDPSYYDQAKEVVETLLESKKNLVVSSTWVQFKKMLNCCRFLESQPLPSIIMEAKCGACRRIRNLSECLVFYDEQHGEKITPPVKEFKVGCVCADKGFIYHELQHHDFQLKQSCTEKVNAVRAMPGIESNQDIVEHCILYDNEWLDLLFETFQSLLDKADEYAVGGKKYLKMKTHCSNFHN